MTGDNILHFREKGGVRKGRGEKKYISTMTSTNKTASDITQQKNQKKTSKTRFNKTASTSDSRLSLFTKERQQTGRYSKNCNMSNSLEQIALKNERFARKNSYFSYVFDCF